MATRNLGQCDLSVRKTVVRIVMATVVAISLMPRPSSGAVPAPAKKTVVDPKSIAAVNAAAQVLLKEYAAGMKEKPPKLAREKSDYFPNPAPPEITPDAVLAVLEKPIGSDRIAEAYVKWQLLSALPSQWPAELVDRAIAVYQKAPLPNPSPGLSHSELDRALYKVGVTKREHEGDVNAAYRTQVDAAAAMNRPILMYRNEMFGRLPQTFPAILAGVNDLEGRAARGVSVGDFWQTLSGAIRGWAALGGKPGEMTGLASELGKLKTTVADGKSMVYSNVYWQDNKTQLAWKADPVIDPKLLDDTATLLRNSAANPGGGIKFKDPK